jgi:hypothetical protein
MSSIRPSTILQGLGLGGVLIGIGLLGLAFGYSLKVDATTAMTGHPLFAVGRDCAMTGVTLLVVCGLFRRKDFASE